MMQLVIGVIITVIAMLVYAGLVELYATLKDKQAQMAEKKRKKREEDAEAFKAERAKADLARKSVPRARAR